MCRARARVSTYMTWIIIFLPSRLVIPVVKDFSLGVGCRTTYVLSFIFLFGIRRNPCVLLGLRKLEIFEERQCTLSECICRNVTRDARFELHRKSGIAYHKRGFEMCFRTAILSHLDDSFYKRVAWIVAYLRVKWRKRCMAFILAVW